MSLPYVSGAPRQPKFALDDRVDAELEFTLVEERDADGIEEENGSVFGLRGDAGKREPEPAHALFAQGKAGGLNREREQ